MTTATRRELAQSAIMRALRVRRAVDIHLSDAVCPFDVAERNGVEVWFQALASAEGMRGAESVAPTIVVSSLRPPGRQAFTCAHELGHEMFDHGVQIDELVDLRDAPRRDKPEEFIADTFAGALLMPKSAVDRGLAVRGWSTGSCTPREVFALASWLGVGYTTLIGHMEYSLQSLDHAHAEKLRKAQPKRIRHELLGGECPHELVIADAHWCGRPVDIQVDDFVLMPPGSHATGECIGVMSDGPERALFRGSTPGIGRLLIEEVGWSSFVRVSRRGYVGRNRYRHLEETHEDE